VLVTVVIGSAVMPTLIAQAWFAPKVAPSAEQAQAAHHLVEVEEHV
jgi:hypothetical protein